MVNIDSTSTRVTAGLGAAGLAFAACSAGALVFGKVMRKHPLAFWKVGALAGLGAFVVTGTATYKCLPLFKRAVEGEDSARSAEKSSASTPEKKPTGEKSSSQRTSTEEETPLKKSGKKVKLKQPARKPPSGPPGPARIHLYGPLGSCRYTTTRKSGQLVLTDKITGKTRHITLGKPCDKRAVYTCVTRDKVCAIVESAEDRITTLGGSDHLVDIKEPGSRLRILGFTDELTPRLIYLRTSKETPAYREVVAYDVETSAIAGIIPLKGFPRHKGHKLSAAGCTYDLKSDLEDPAKVLVSWAERGKAYPFAIDPKIFDLRVQGPRQGKRFVAKCLGNQFLLYDAQEKSAQALRWNLDQEPEAPMYVLKPEGSEKWWVVAHLGGGCNWQLNIADSSGKGWLFSEPSRRSLTVQRFDTNHEAPRLIYKRHGTRDEEALVTVDLSTQRVISEEPLTGR